MHPWELRRYSMQSFVEKVQGVREFAWSKEKTQWEMIRALAFDHAVMQGRELKEKKPSIYRYWPLPWDKKKGIAAIDNPQSRMEAILELRRKYLQAAKISNN